MDAAGRRERSLSDAPLIDAWAPDDGVRRVLIVQRDIRQIEAAAGIGLILADLTVILARGDNRCSWHNRAA